MNKNFNPPHCPNPDCCRHTVRTNTDNRVWYVRRGSRQLRQRDEYKVKLFICKSCNCCFSENSFRSDYYEKINISPQEIIRVMRPGISLKQWAEELGTTRATLKLRLYKLCWILIERLERSGCNNGLIGGLLCETHRRLAEGEGEFVLLRELIVRLRRLFTGGYGRCFFGWNRRGGWGDTEREDGGKQNLLTALWLLPGRWRYPMPPEHIWYPAYPTYGSKP